MLTDVVMPGMNGRQVYEAVSRLRPGISVLYMSGHTDRVIVRQGILEKGIDFIQKPYSTDRLLAKVRHVLDRGSTRLLESTEPESQAEPKVCLKNARVLLAEDNPMNAQLIRTMLDGVVGKVDVAHNGREAVDAARATL